MFLWEVILRHGFAPHPFLILPLPTFAFTINAEGDVGMLLRSSKDIFIAVALSNYLRKSFYFE